MHSRTHHFVIDQQAFVIHLPEDFYRQIPSAQDAVCFSRGINVRYPEILCFSGQHHDLQQSPQRRALGSGCLTYQTSQWTEGSGGTETLLRGNLQLGELVLAVTATSQREVGADLRWSFDYLKRVMIAP